MNMININIDVQNIRFIFLIKKHVS